MKRFSKPSMIFAALTVASFGSLVGAAYLALTSFSNDRTTTTRLSPDETTLARLVEASPPWALDRNFRVDLVTLADGTATIIFRSPDEGQPAGTDRLIWSRDGTKLLLVGRHFFVKDDLFLDNGDQLYLLYDRPSGKLWCNSAEGSRFAPLQAEQIRGVEFTEPVVLRDVPPEG